MKKLIWLVLVITIIACESKKGSETKEMPLNTHFQEPHRLQFHFSPKEKWMNDPNGMVYHNGEYHLFYQFYPDSTVWGPMHWGHAVSKDLLHWEHLPIALYPDDLGYIFSGSAVLDKQNTSGFGSIENPPLVAIFTYHDIAGERAGDILFQTQAIAFSLDNGRTWTKYDGNPVIKNPGIKDFRDPKVFWLDSENKWIMALAVKDHISFYSSKNLRDWKQESDFGLTLGAHGGVWECPDLFRLDDQWVLLVSINPGGPNGGSATQYFVGDFDGKTFTPQDGQTRWLDYGRDNYAGITWSNIPDEDGRKIFIGWMSNWDYANVVPTEKWRSAMTLPRFLSLDKNKDGYIVKSTLIKEVEMLHGSSQKLSATHEKVITLNPAGWALYDLNLELAAPSSPIPSFEIQLFNEVGDTLKLGYDSEEKQFYINRDKAGKNDFADNFKGIQTAPLSIEGKTTSIRLLVDVGSVEIFINEGELAMTSLFFPQQPMNKAQMTIETTQPCSVNGNIFEMKSIWN